jgi:hypothetical protein
MSQPVPESEGIVMLICMTNEFAEMIDGSRTEVCVGCNRTLFVSPHGQAQMARDPRTVPLCVDCALLYAPDEEVRSLPGSDALVRERFGDDRADYVAGLMGRPLRDLPIERLRRGEGAES